MSTRQTPLYTREEYFDIDRLAETKSEYYAGRIYSMAGGTPEHAGIAVNTLIAIGRQLRGTAGRLFNSDLRVAAGRLLTYPDVTIVCGKPEYVGTRADVLKNPVVLIEVLSESTEAYDRGEKFGFYRNIGSLREYLLVCQDRPRLERFLRQTDGTWVFTVADGLGATLNLVSACAELKLAEVYDGIELPPAPALRSCSAHVDHPDDLCLSDAEGAAGADLAIGAADGILDG